MSDFNFKQYNELVNPAPAGLKLWMIESLLKDVVAVTFRYHNPLNKEMYQLLEEVESLRKRWKDLAAKKSQNDSSEASAKIDNMEDKNQTSTSTDGGKVDQPTTEKSDMIARILDKQRNGVKLTDNEERIIKAA